MFLRIFKHLLPNARAWRLTIDKQLRQFFEGLTGLGVDFKTYVDQVWLDVFPQTTRELDAWEQQWGLPSTTLTTQERRDRLDGAWKALGGQSPRYIQDTLQDAGFNVFVFDWWSSPLGPKPIYIAECGEPVAECGEPVAECGALLGFGPPENPVVRDPFTVLTDGTIPFGYFLSSGAAGAVCGGVQAICGAATGVTGGLLVNKPLNNVIYNIPTDEAEWPFILYIGGQTFGDRAIISLARRDEFEALCLKICPAQQWIGLIVEYS